MSNSINSTKNSSICESMAPDELKKAAGRPLIIDVRSPIEFETEHLEGSVNIPLEQLEARSEELPRIGALVVVCRSGKRAERGAYVLLGKGLQPKILAGGLLAWRKAGLPVKEGKKMLSIERQIQLIVGVGVLTGVLMGAFINPWFLVIPAFFGMGLTFAGLSGTCALGLLLMKAPWNQLPFRVEKTADESGRGCCA